MDSKELFFWTGIPLYHRPIDNGSKLIYDPISNWEKEPTFLKLKEGTMPMLFNLYPAWKEYSLSKFKLSLEYEIFGYKILCIDAPIHRLSEYNNKHIAKFK